MPTPGQEPARPRANTAAVDEEAWVERLRRTVSEGLAAPPTAVEDGPSDHERSEAIIDLAAEALVDAPAVARALRDLERRVSAVDIRLRQLNEEWDRLVAEVADAVVARLDDRERTLSD